MKKVVVLTGAGMSAESGLSTFRDSGGLWDRYPVEDVATPEGYAGSTKVIHLHGELTKVTSSLEPDNPKYIRELRPEEWEVKIGDRAADGSQLRPFIVWFGEAVPMIGTAIDVTSTADIFVVIGTSLNVYPAAGLLNYVPSHAPIYVIDPKPVAGIQGGGRVHHLMKGASEGVEELMACLEK